MLSPIRPVTLDDIVGLERYESMRSDLRRQVIELKRHRRLATGGIVTFVFENHATMYFQVQEMLRAEQITDVDAVREELAVYNALLPKAGELSATMLIEITEQDDIEERLSRLVGIDKTVCMKIGAEQTVAAQFEAGRSREDMVSAVQYVRFAFSNPARRAFLDQRVPAWLVIEHPNYREQAAIEGGVRASLVEDLRRVE